MGRKIIYDNYRVEVEPEAPLFERDNNHSFKIAQCEELRLGIRRHVDGVRSATVQYDTNPVCEFCGRAWTEGKDDSHNGGCCDQDAANMPEESEAS